MKKGKTITVNSTKYFIQCVWSYEEKMSKKDGLMGIKLGILVTNLETNENIPWKDIRGTYLAEKIVDYAENSFNGQNSLYWDWSREEVI